MFKHRLADLKLNVPFIGDDCPCQWKRTLAVRERDAQDRECRVAHKTAIEDDRDLPSRPGGEYLLDQRLVERATHNPFARPPAANTRDRPGGLGVSRKMIGNFAELDRLALD